MRLQYNNSQFTLTIPAAVCKAKGWAKGDEVELVIDNMGQVILRKK